MATTLADLIAADGLHPLTRWLLNAIQRMKPSKEMLAKPAAVQDKALPDFRRAAGGVITVDDVLVANSSGKGYFNGQTGKWKEIAPLIKAWLSGKKAVKAMAWSAGKKTRVQAIADVPVSNEAMNLKWNGPVETRKTWINYELEERIGEAYRD